MISKAAVFARVDNLSGPSQAEAKPATPNAPGAFFKALPAELQSALTRNGQRTSEEVRSPEDQTAPEALLTGVPIPGAAPFPEPLAASKTKPFNFAFVFPNFSDEVVAMEPAAETAALVEGESLTASLNPIAQPDLENEAPAKFEGQTAKPILPEPLEPGQSLAPPQQPNPTELPQAKPPQANPLQANPPQANPPQANPLQANPLLPNPLLPNPPQANPPQPNPPQVISPQAIDSRKDGAQIKSTPGTGQPLIEEEALRARSRANAAGSPDEVVVPVSIPLAIPASQVETMKPTATPEQAIAERSPASVQVSRPEIAEPLQPKPSPAVANPQNAGTAGEMTDDPTSFAARLFKQPSTELPSPEAKPQSELKAGGSAPRAELNVVPLGSASDTSSSTGSGTQGDRQQKASTDDGSVNVPRTAEVDLGTEVALDVPTPARSATPSGTGDTASTRPVAAAFPAPATADAPPQPLTTSAAAFDRAEKVLNAQAGAVAQGPAQPMKELSLSVAGERNERVDVRLVDRAGELHVAVKTPDAVLSETLRGNLNELANSLGKTGIGSEIWSSSSDRSSFGNQSARDEGQPQNPKQDESRSPFEKDARDRNRQQPDWVEELEKNMQRRRQAAGAKQWQL